MPDLGITEALAIASIISGAAATGTGIYSSMQQSGAADAQNQAAKSAQDLAAQQAAQQKQQAIKASVANAQEQTGGSLTGGGLANLASLLAGYRGQAGGAQPISSPSSSSSGASGTSSGLQDVLSQLSSPSPAPSANFNGGS